jgi:hypothetical protein
VCLLTLKHLVSLQARARPLVQDELDLHNTALGITYTTRHNNFQTKKIKKK